MKNFGLSLICVLVFLLSLFYLLEVYRNRLSDTALFGGDTWEYQSLGVNLCLGHGYQFGGIEEFATYKFDRTGREYVKNYDYFTKEKGYNFYRTPGYPLFLAFVYKLFGIHPSIVKVIQLILLAVSVALLPIIGNYYWSKLGILAGIFSSILSVKYYLPDPSDMMAEPLITFSLFVLVLFLMFWETKPSNIRTLFLGIVIAMTVLIKELSIFVPIFLLLYIILKFRKTTKKLQFSFTFILGVFLCILPWSIYASIRQGSFVLLSTHGSILLFDSNNEDSLKTGDWAPDWRKQNKDNPKYLYNRLKNSDYSPIKKVLIFMIQNKKAIPMLLKNKFKVFLDDKVYPIVTGMFLYYLISILTVKHKISINEKILIFPLVYFLNLFFIILLFHGIYRYVLPFAPFFVLPTVYLFFKILKLLMLNKFPDIDRLIKQENTME